MQLFAKFKKILRMGFRATLYFQKFKVALNPLRRICSKLELRVFFAGHIVAMVTYWATKLTATYFPMIVQFVDTMMLVSTSIEWL